MSLREQQNVLAKLFTDPQFRSAFHKRPEETGKVHDLTPSEINELVQVEPTAVEEYAVALLFKRLRAVENLLPLTSRLLGKDRSRLFFDFAASEISEGPKKNFFEARGFCVFLESAPSAIAKDVAAVARFERKRLEFFHDRRRLTISTIPPVLGEEVGTLSSLSRYFGDRRARVAAWLRIGRRTLQIRL